MKMKFKNKSKNKKKGFLAVRNGTGQIKLKRGVSAEVTAAQDRGEATEIPPPDHIANIKKLLDTKSPEELSHIRKRMPMVIALSKGKDSEEAALMYAVDEIIRSIVDAHERHGRLREPSSYRRALENSLESVFLEVSAEILGNGGKAYSFGDELQTFWKNRLDRGDKLLTARRKLENALGRRKVLITRFEHCQTDDEHDRTILALVVGFCVGITAAERTVKENLDNMPNKLLAQFTIAKPPVELF